MNLKEGYFNKANDILGKDQETEVEDENPQLKQHMYKMIKEYGTYNIIAELINVLEEEDPEMALILQKAVGPLPEN
jgi:hypothetical protein